MHGLTRPLKYIAGHAGGTQGQRRSVRCEGLEEGRHPPGRRRGLHHDREEDFGSGPKTPLPNPALLLLPDQGMLAKGAVVGSIVRHNA